MSRQRSTREEQPKAAAASLPRSTILFLGLLIMPSIVTSFSALLNNNNNDLAGGGESARQHLTDEQIVLLSQQKCSDESEKLVNRCLQPILNYATTIQQQTNGAPLSLKGGDMFRKLCLLYHQFTSCTSQTQCLSISVRAVDASYGYMCGQGYKLFEEHATCFAEVENQPEYNQCKHAAGEAMDDALHLKKSDVDGYFRRLCHIMDSYLQCCRPFVNEKCGREAWQLVAQITMDSLQVTMPTCDINHIF